MTPLWGVSAVEIETTRHIRSVSSSECVPQDPGYVLDHGIAALVQAAPIEADGGGVVLQVTSAMGQHRRRHFPDRLDR